MFGAREIVQWIKYLTRDQCLATHMMNWAHQVRPLSTEPDLSVAQKQTENVSTKK